MVDYAGLVQMKEMEQFRFFKQATINAFNRTTLGLPSSYAVREVKLIRNSIGEI